jgi:hypothetical protein
MGECSAQDLEFLDEERNVLNGFGYRRGPALAVSTHGRTNPCCRRHLLLFGPRLVIVAVVPSNFVILIVNGSL